MFLLIFFVINFVFKLSVGHYGAVSALDISRDGTKLLCGHAKGLVSLLTQQLTFILAPLSLIF